MALSLAVHSLTLQAFRNYDWLELPVDAPFVVLSGPNGAGKTNILEALSFLAPGRGLRSASLREIDRQHGATPWAMRAVLRTGGADVQIGSGRNPDAAVDNRLIHIDGEPVGRQQKLAEQCAVLWLTPPMEQLFSGPASERRRFFDRVAYSFAPDHVTHLNHYAKVMRERNRMLSEGVRDPHWLGAVEQRMAEHGVAIAAARVECAERINGALMQMEGGFPRGWVEMEGAYEHQLQEESALAVEEKMRWDWEQGRQEDARAGRTLSGPHRSDLSMMYDVKKQPARLCSTGEQKALMLSFILAVAQARKAWFGAAPLLLFDEVVAHLDASRRAALFGQLQALESQIWMTGTDATTFAPLGSGAQMVSVDNGQCRIGEQVAVTG